MNALRRFWTAVLLATIAAGCTSSNRGTRPPAYRADVITKEEMHSRAWSNAYDMIAALRGNWLSSRGPDSALLGEEVQVLVDGAHLGGIGMLRTQPIGSLIRAQYYDPITAAARWGLKFNKGAIDLWTVASANEKKP